MTIIPTQSHTLDEAGETVRVYGLVLRANFRTETVPGTIEIYRESGFRALSADETATLGALLLELSELVRIPARKAAEIVEQNLDRCQDRD